MAVVTIILAKRGAGTGDMPVPSAVYDAIDVNTITTAEDAAITASLDNQFWFVIPDAAVRVLEKASGGSAVTSSTGWPVAAGERWEAKATNGSTLSIIAV